MQGRNHTLQAPSIDMVSPTTMTNGGNVLICDRHFDPASPDLGLCRR
jgi:hypothetical protein